MKSSNLVKKRKNRSRKSIKGLVIKLDNVFSRYIRLRDKGVCITCGKKDLIKNMDCGHYVSRLYKSTRWNERNCACQCPHDNRFMEGCKDVFALKLQAKYGNNILKELNNEKQKIIKFTEEDLKEKIEYYQNKVKEFNEI